MPHFKTAPHDYLVAAEHLPVRPARGLVIEDTATGVRARLDASATVWDYCPAGHNRAFEGPPVARMFRHRDELVAVLVGQ